MSKSASKNSQKKRNNTEEKSKKSSSRSFKKRLAIFSLKLSFTLACVGVFYLAYLDSIIRHKMDGQIWQLPAEVYSRIPVIRLNEKPDLSQVRALLLDNNYRQTTTLATPGDFKIENDTLLLIRRAFPFPDRAEAQRVLRLRFEQQQLQAIEDLVQQRTVDSFRLAPKLITLLESNNEERLAIRLQQYPRLLIDTLILTEDKRFFQHDGISFIGITRALITNLKAGQTVQGGSTLTQQLVKNLFLSNKRSLSRKANEALMALLMDWRYDKNRILETYLNEVYLGQNGNTQIHGFALASQFYFGKPIQEISLDQIALLVGMVKGPSIYNPWRYPDNALTRRNVVLRLMLDNKIIDQSLYNLLSKRPLNVQAKGKIQRSKPSFIQAVQSELAQLFAETKTTQLSGSRIFTTLDMKLQNQVESAVSSSINLLEKQKKISELETAVVIADYHTGEIRAMVGGSNPYYAGFNRATQAKRQIGSLIKPAIYLTALDNPDKYRLNSLLANQAITIKIKGSPAWQPRNYDRKFSAPVTLLEGLTRSLNIPTVNLGMQLGLDEVIQTQKRLGWNKMTIPKVPSMLLGSYAVSPFDVTKLYQTIANAGRSIPLATIDSISANNGESLYQRNFQPAQVVSPESSIQTLFAMQQVVKQGTARSLQSQFAHLNLAGKTGTTNDGRDSWFVAVDNNNVTTVWVGKDNNQNTRLTGATGALVVYQTLLKNINTTPLQLPYSEHIQWIGINENGQFDCNSHYTIPVWNNGQQDFCHNEPQGSVWDVLGK